MSTKFPPMRRFQGLGVAEGIAIGTAVCISSRLGDIYQIPLPENEVEDEVIRFRQAVLQSQDELRRLRDRVSIELNGELGGIFEAQAMILADPLFLAKVEGHIREESVNAEWALQESLAEFQSRFDALDSEYLRERSEDLRHVCRSVVRSLRGIQFHHLSEVEGEIIIVADELAPSDAVRLGRERVVGFVIEHGSRTSHTTIIARSLNIPAVLGVSGIRQELLDQPEARILIDGDQGTIFLFPDESTLDLARRQLEAHERKDLELLELGRMRAETLDQVEIKVMANIDLPEEINEVKRLGAAGIGLYRSEFLYIEKHPQLPSEEEHVAIYRRLIEAAAPDPAIIRTYDLGGRKIAREVMETHEENPVLGLRGIRLTLARPEIFKTQIRALIRATIYGELWIMLPMVTIVEELRLFRRSVEEAMAELEAEGIPFHQTFKLGTMIEVPAAALISDVLAREVDFFSIGTNDLIQYSLAVDRNNEHVAHLYRPLHPAIIKLLLLVIASARRAGREVSLCGEMAADPRYLPILLGCGLRRLSVNPRQVPMIKRRIRELRLAGLDLLARACSDLATADEVEDHLRRELGETVESQLVRS